MLNWVDLPQGTRPSGGMETGHHEDMEKFSALLAHYGGKPPDTRGFTLTKGH